MYDVDDELCIIDYNIVACRDTVKDYSYGGAFMNVIVHLMFAMTVRKKVKAELGVSINLRGFLFGNILPDISKKYGACPHYMKDALSYVMVSKDNLLYKKSGDFFSSYSFAKNLGAINHYTSDFFCLPHTEGYQGSKAHHGIYELLMIARYRKGLRGYRTLLEKQNDLLEPHDLKSFIEEQNKGYIQKQASDVNDIRYALFAGTKLSESLIAYSTSFSGSLNSSLTASYTAY